MKNSPLKGPFQQTFYTNNAHRGDIILERIRKTRQIQKIETTWRLPLITNVKVVSRYIALGHDTYREPPYRYCIDISPYRLIPSKNGVPFKKKLLLSSSFVVNFFNLLYAIKYVIDYYLCTVKNNTCSNKHN